MSWFPEIVAPAWPRFEPLRAAPKNGLCYLAAPRPKQSGNRRRVLFPTVSDILIMTLGLLAGVLGCLARPCKPENWTHVKATRVALAAIPETVHEQAIEPAPVSEPGFADGLAAAAAA